MSIENCELWNKAKNLADKRGIDMSRKCPMDSVCNGSTCVFIEPIEKLEEESKIETPPIAKLPSSSY